MMKFFRKHMKELLAFFMCLLLVAWLGGTALTSILRTDAIDADREIARMFGEAVQQRDLWPVASELEVLDDLGGIWRHRPSKAVRRWVP